MQNIKPVSTEYQKLQAAWKKAAKVGELVVPCQNLSDARRLRFSLYNAVKPVREGKVHAPELLEAISSVSLQIRENPIRLIMQNRAFSSAIAALDSVLDEEDFEEAPTMLPVMTPEEAESFNRVQELLKQPETAEETAARKNPFYTRER